MKRLIVCCDGTWQGLGNTSRTNVATLAAMIQRVDPTGVHQVLHYSEGIGSHGNPLARLKGGAFGHGIDDSIQTAYQFLCANYEPGDHIYLLGFSRGAYTVRSLAGMIYCSGLLRREFIHKGTEAYQLYRNRQDKPSGYLAQEFRAAWGHRVPWSSLPEALLPTDQELDPQGSTQLPIKGLGCWDTVGSLGIPNLSGWLGGLNAWINRKYRFHDTELNRYIEQGFHAVAVDERLQVFDITPMEPSTHLDPSQVKQFWFPGNHGCVGGGTAETQPLAQGALRWMMEQVGSLGLTFKDLPETGEAGDPLCPFPAQPQGVFRLARQRWRDPYQDLAQNQPLTMDDLHSSTKQRWQRDPGYRPQNLASLGELKIQLDQQVEPNDTTPES